MKRMILFLTIISSGLLLTMTNTHDAYSYELPCLAVFADLANPTGYNTNHFPHGSVIKYNGFVVDQRDGSRIANAQIMVDIEGSRGSVVRGLELVSDNQGKFEFAINTEDFLRLGMYMITVSAIVEEAEEGCDRTAHVGGTFSVTRMYQYVISAEGRDFDVSIQSIEYEISDLEFDKDSKSISFNVKKVGNKSDYSRDGFLQLRGIVITIERPLLDAPFTYIINDPLFDEPRRMRSQVNSTHSTLQIFPLVPSELSDDSNEDNSRVAIIGTYVVPEFPLSLIIASVAIGVMIAITRIRKSTLT